MKMLNIGPILAQHWYSIILRNCVESILGYWHVTGKPRVMLTLRKNVSCYGHFQSEWTSLTD